MATPNWDTIPAPSDDGACDHLLHSTIPSISLPSTSNSPTDISTLPGLTILFFYPRTAAPHENVPETWNAIPGARGCTPQACSFRDASDEFGKYGVSRIFGCSTQSTEYQRELKERTKLNYELLSDEELKLAEGMGLPTFEWEDKKLIKRLTVAVEGGKVVRVWYPVFPPDRSAAEVLGWLKERAEKKL
jgi:peroxiredoxin